MMSLSAWQGQVDIIAAFSFVGFVLISIPLYWHCSSWNVGCILYIFWVGGQCLFHGINLLIWKDNVINSAPVWCDFFIRFYIAASIGVCSASLVINRRLYLIASVSVVSLRYEDKVRNILVDLFIGLGIPLLSVAVFWFYQGHRFNLMEGVGCVEAYPNTYLALGLYFLWPIIIGGVSAVYCFFTLKAFLRRRKQFSELMASNEHITYNRYFRLMGLAALEFVFTIPLALYNTITNFKQDKYPWRGFSELHSNFHRVDQYPAVIWRADPQGVSIINFRLWTPIACAFAFFLLFGFANEAIKHYKMLLSALGVKIGDRTLDSRGTGFRSSGAGTRGSGRPTIPAFVNRPARRGSMESFYSDDVSTRDSAIGLSKKPSRSLSSRSVGSSTFLEGPQDTIPSPVAPPVPALPSPTDITLPMPEAAYIPSPVPPPIPSLPSPTHITLPIPEAAYIPSPSQHESGGVQASTTAGVQASTTAGPDMV